MTQKNSTLRPPGAADFALLLLLALTWGSSFFFIKQAVETLPPLSLAVGRITIGAAMLLIIAFAKGQEMPRGLGLWGRMIFLGIIGNSLPFFLIGWGEQYTPSNLAAILMATIPSFVIVLAHFFTHDEPLTLGKALGALLGFAGVLALIGVDALKGLGDVVIGQIAILAGAFSYSLYGVNAKRLPPLGSEMLVGTILLAGLVPLIPVWLVIDQPWTLAPDGEAWFSVGWLGLLSTGGGNLLFFLLLRRVGAGFGSFNNYLVPLMGVGWGFFLAGERPSWNALVALLLILTGLALARWLKPSFRASVSKPAASGR
ncbi:DMT family transporter [Dongia deserti]|uniref:DMT family transporter n=1 Tax=Dongia deserti TaxID=2268030 RepID=UPI000E658F4A|nr:DMT family transporter [Dongia deserti]